MSTVDVNFTLTLYSKTQINYHREHSMPVIVIILVVLFTILIIGVPLIEKYSTEKSDEELQKITRFMTPLMIIFLIAAAARYFIF